MSAHLQETETASFNKKLNLEVWVAMAFISGRPSAMLGEVPGRRVEGCTFRWGFLHPGGEDMVASSLQTQDSQTSERGIQKG